MWHFIMVMVMKKLQDKIQNLKDLRTKKFKIIEYGIIERPRLQPFEGIFFIVNDNNNYIGSSDDDVSYNKEEDDDVTRKKTLLKHYQIEIEILMKQYCQ